MTLNRLGFSGTASGHFHLSNNETENMLVHNTQPNYSFLFVYEKLYTFRENLSARFLNALGTDFRL